MTGHRLRKRKNQAQPTAAPHTRERTRVRGRSGVRWRRLQQHRWLGSVVLLSLLLLLLARPVVPPPRLLVFDSSTVGGSSRQSPRCNTINITNSERWRVRRRPPCRRGASTHSRVCSLFAFRVEAEPRCTRAACTLSDIGGVREGDRAIDVRERGMGLKTSEGGVFNCGGVEDTTLHLGGHAPGTLPRRRRPTRGTRTRTRTRSRRRRRQR